MPANLAVGPAHRNLDVERRQARPRLSRGRVEGLAMLGQDHVVEEGGVGHHRLARDTVHRQAARTGEDEAPRTVGPGFKHEGHAERCGVGRRPHDRIACAQFFARSIHRLLYVPPNGA